MRSKTKNMTIALLAGASALFLGGALALNAAEPAKVHAAEGVIAFVDIGASEAAAAADSALSLTAGNITAATEGTVTVGDTLFAGYAVGATYTVSASAGEYQIAVALDIASGDTLNVNGQNVALTGTGRTVVSTTATVSGNFTVAATGKLCGILVAEKDSKVLMTLDYTEGQVIQYGALLDDVLDKTATGHYSDGTTADFEIEYGNITASTGINVNFTTVDVTGTVTADGMTVSVSRYLTTMPDGLVYFINCGSYTEDGLYEDTADLFYGYNETLFDYYGHELLNDGIPDRIAPNSNEWGAYCNAMSKFTHSAPGDATFPYNSFVWMEDDGTAEIGYYLTGLNADTNYRIWVGTLSHWHGRTVRITFNGSVVGEDTLKINASKGFTIFENVTPDSSGKIDMKMKGASTNEPCINFIAVQEMSTPVSEKPASVQSDPIIEVGQTTVTVTGVTEGAKIQLYNAAKPNQLLYEEAVDTEKLAGERYTVDFGTPLTVAQFYIVQVTDGGVSDTPLLITITDITQLTPTVSPDPADGGYSLGTVTVTVTMHAGSGITQWLWKQGEYGEEHIYMLDRPADYVGTFVAEENDTYHIIATSGLGVTREETVAVTNIDPDRPVLDIIPSVEGFGEGGYHATLRVTSVAPVTEYKLFKDGVQQGDTQSSVPASVTFPGAGQYVVYVKTAVGLTSTKNVTVSAQPTMTLVKKSFANNTCRYTFADTSDYKVASVTVYKIDGSSAERQTIDAGNVFNVFYSGKYVARVTTSNGEIELFSLDVSEEDVKGTAEAGVSKGLSLGLGLGIGIGGVVIAAVAVTVCAVLTKKKKS